jgi:hypothetical protein
MDYLRALLQRHEHSARALALTGRVVTLNPSHYAVWSALLVHALCTSVHVGLPW